MRVRVAVVGVGHLGQYHAQKLHQIENAELVALCDLDERRGQELASQLQVGFVRDYRQLAGRVDAVTIAAVTPAHFELGQFFLSQGVHVFMEKPLTSRSQEGRKLCELAESQGLVLQVGHVERFNPAFVSALERMGRPLFIECHRLAPFKPRSTDVDVVLDLMIHDLDVILSLVRSDPIQVSAVGAPVLTQLTDIANARIEFASGAVANVTASRVSQATQRKFRVFEENQYTSIDFQTGEVNLLTKTGEWQGESLPLDHQSWNLEKGDALLAEARDFIGAVKEGQAPRVSGRAGLRALELAEQIMDEIAARRLLRAQ